MKQITMQSILLEEHLTQKEKRCQDCIAKHFLHIIALHGEAIWLAGNKIQNYPLMEKTIGFYNKLFERWLNDKNNDANLLAISEELRITRKNSCINII